MNKTININLAGISFHIDEDAYGKLSRYLHAIKKSLRDSEGREEIMQDIESRIAELFSEKLTLPAQVVTMRELDEVIAIMGQPEDYELDDESFDETPPSGNASYSGYKKQLYRDIDNKYIGGVSSGLAHFLGIDPLWIRLLWVILVLAGLGSPIVFYLLLWILIPPALTTSEKLKMTGEPINISNIEKKFRESFDNVADKFKNVDYNKYGSRIKTGASRFFDSLAEIIVALFKIFAKFIGVVIVVLSLSVLVSLIIGFFTVGNLGVWNNEFAEYVAMANTDNNPLWIWSLLILLAVGIPFFALFVLGLKLLISNLRSMGSTVKIVLVIIWALSIGGLIFLGISQAGNSAFNGNVIEEKTFAVKPSDTLAIEMRADNQFSHKLRRNSELQIKYTKDNKRIIYSTNLEVILKPTSDSVGKIIIEKLAEGNTYLDAKKRAEKIAYEYSANAYSIILNGFFTTDPDNKFRNQKVEVTIFVPVGVTVYPKENVSTYFGYNNEFIDYKFINSSPHYYKFDHQVLKCLDCEEVIEQADNLDTIKAVDTLTKSWEEEVEKQFQESKSTL